MHSARDPSQSFRTIMNVLALNCGSSTLKFQLRNPDGIRRLASGVVERIGGPAQVGSALRQARSSATSAP